MKRFILTIAVLAMIITPLAAADISAGAGVEGIWAQLSYDGDRGYDAKAIGGVFGLRVSNDMGLDLGLNVGVAAAMKPRLNGQEWASLLFGTKRCEVFHADIKVLYHMPTEFGAYAGAQAFWRNAVFTEGGRLNDWKRLSIHSLGVGAEAGLLLRRNSTMFSLGLRYDKPLKSWVVYSEREDWETKTHERYSIDATGRTLSLVFGVTASY